jgi:hypothetical protein
MDLAFLYYLNPLLVEEPKEPDETVTSVFLLEDRYSRYKFQGIIPNTGIAKYFIVGYN